MPNKWQSRISPGNSKLAVKKNSQEQSSLILATSVQYIINLFRNSVRYDSRGTLETHYSLNVCGAIMTQSQ